MALTVRREEPAALQESWAQFLSRLPEPVPFLHPTWHRVWLEEFQDSREHLLLSVRDGDDVVGIAPLLRDGDCISFVGHYSICDYMDILVAPDRARDVVSALFESLAGESWSQLDLRGLRDGSPTLAELPGIVESAGHACEREEEAVAPRVETPGDWDAYLSSLSKRNRHELRRKLRRIQAAGELEVHTYTTADEIEEHLPVLLRFMVDSRADKANFMSEQMGRFFHRMARALAEEGLVRLYELELDTKAVASVLCFDQGGQLYLYNSGYDPDYAGLGVGIGSKALCLRDAIEAGRHCVDFLRGDEPYKYDLGAQDQQVYRLTVTRS